MKKLVLLLVMVLGVIPTMWADVSVQTKILDATSQPPIVGGFIENYSKENVSKKGIIVSKRDDDLVITEETDFHYADVLLKGKDGVSVGKPYDIRFIDCTDTNEEQFACLLQYLEGNTDYYVRAFVINASNNVLYGSIEKLHTKDYNRYGGNADYGNVWYAFDYTLFDLSTDEIIDPNNGFYYSTNENPTRVGHQVGTGYNTCYKFLTEWNYKLWYSQLFCWDSSPQHNGKSVHIPQMTYSDGMLTIEKNTLDADKDITIYYSINGNYFRPETYTDVYTAPINISEPCVVYCYAISSEGYISYTNMYVIDNRIHVSDYKSLNDYIAHSDINNRGEDCYINPIINNVKKVYIDLTKGSNNSLYCYLGIGNGEDEKICFSSKYLQSTSTDNIYLYENNIRKTCSIKELADNKTYSWLYYNPNNSNEVIIDIKEYYGKLGYITKWQMNFETSCVVNIVTGDSETHNDNSDYIEVSGDVSGDGQITPADAIMILYYYFGLDQIEFNAKAADLNGDGSVTPADAIEALYRYFGASSNARAARPVPSDICDPE